MAKLANKEPVKRKPAKRKRAARAKILTIQELADGIGVSTRTVDKYCKRGMPRTSIADALKWRSENIKSAIEDAEVSDLGVERLRAEITDKWESARTRQQKNDERAEKFILKDEVRLDISIAVSRFKNKLNSLGLKCANLCPSELKAPIKKAIEDTVSIAFRELSEDLGRT